MRKMNCFAAALIAGSSVLFSGCGFMTQQTAVQNSGSTTTSSTANSLLTAAATAAVSSAVSSATSSLQESAGSALSSINSNSLISGIIGMLTNGMAASNSVVGSWTYAEPTVQFESQNFLAQAGGAIAASALVSKIQPYYEQIGIKQGVMALKFNEDGTGIITFKNTPIPCRYTYDAASHKLEVSSAILGKKLFSAYVTVASNQLAFTLDASKLLDMTKTIGASSSNSAASSISSIAGQFNGMKTGFMFTRN